MIISHEYKFIYIKNQKVAGSSLELFFSKICPRTDFITENDNFRNRVLISPKRDIRIQKELDFASIIPFRGVRRWKVRSFPYLYFYNHMPATEVRALVGNKIWNQYFKFAVERNPFEKAVSHYYGFYGKNPCISFRDFVYAFPSFSDYSKYTDRNGDIIVDRVVQFDNINEEIGSICSMLGIHFPGTLKEKIHANARPKTDYRNLYTENEKSIISYICQKEIERFSYCF